MEIRLVEGQLFRTEGQRTDRQTYYEADSCCSQFYQSALKRVQISWKYVQWKASYSVRKDKGRTDRHITKLIVAVLSSTKAPKNVHKFHENTSSGRPLIPFGWTKDGQTDVLRSWYLLFSVLPKRLKTCTDFMKIRPVEGQLFRAEGQRTDRQTYYEADSRCSQF